MFGPVVSGPNAQMLRAASKSQSYLLWKNSLSCFLKADGCSSFGFWQALVPVPADLDDLVLDVLSQSFLKRLRNHRQLVPKGR